MINVDNETLWYYVTIKLQLEWPIIHLKKTLNYQLLNLIYINQSYKQDRR